MFLVVDAKIQCNPLSAKVKIAADFIFRPFIVNQPNYNAVCYVLGSIGLDLVINESYYKGTIIQRNYRKTNMTWSFSYNSFVKFHGKKNGRHIMAVLYPNLYYSEVCCTVFKIRFSLV